MISKPCTAELISLFFKFGLHSPINLFHQCGKVVVVALERFLEKLKQRLVNGVIAN